MGHSVRICGRKKEMEKDLMHRMKGVVGDWNRLVQGKQLFRELCGSFGVISEGCGGVVCLRVD